MPSHPQPPVCQFLRNVPEIHASRRRGRMAPYINCVPSLRITFAFMVCNATCSSPPLFRIRVIFVTLMARFHSLRSRGLQNCVLKNANVPGSSLNFRTPCRVGLLTDNDISRQLGPLEKAGSVWMPWSSDMFFAYPSDPGR